MGIAAHLCVKYDARMDHIPVLKNLKQRFDKMQDFTPTLIIKLFREQTMTLDEAVLFFQITGSTVCVALEDGSTKYATLEHADVLFYATSKTFYHAVSFYPDHDSLTLVADFEQGYLNVEKTLPKVLRIEP